MYLNSVYENIIDVCKASRSNRAQAYVPAETSSYTPGQQMSWSFPNVLMDNTDGYLEVTCDFTNRVTPLPRIQTLRFPTHPTNFNGDSYFRLEYQGFTSPQLNTARLYANPTDMPVGSGNQNLQDILNAMQGPAAYFKPYTVVASTPGSGLFGTNVVFTITFGLGTSPGNFLSDIFHIVDDNNRNGADPFAPPNGNPLAVNYQGSGFQEPTLGFPRLERFAPLILITRVDFDSTNVINVNNCHVLQSMDMLTEIVDSYNSNYWYHNDLENGYYSDVPFRVKIHMKYVPLLHTILPLNSVNAIVKKYLTTTQANTALIQSASNQGYILSDCRWNYHRLILNADEQAKIDSTIKGTGLVIPFTNWFDFPVVIPAGTVQNNVIFNPNCSNLLGVMFSFVNEPYSLDPSNRRKYSTFLNNYITDYRIRINEKYFPLNIVNTIDGTDLVESVEELKRLISLYKGYDYSEGQQQTLFLVYTIPGSQNDPNADQYVAQFDINMRQSAIMGISCADVGYEGPYKKCNMLNQAINGVNTSNVTNCILELKGMDSIINGNAQNNTIFIFALHQDYLIIKGNSFEWIK